MELVSLYSNRLSTDSINIIIPLCFACACGFWLGEGDIVLHHCAVLARLRRRLVFVIMYHHTKVILNEYDNLVQRPKKAFGMPR